MNEEKHHHCEHNHCEHHHEHEHLSKYEQMFALYDMHLHDEAIQEKARNLINNYAAENNTQEVKRFLFSTLELTSLKVIDNEDSVLRMTENVNRFSDANPNLRLAGLCVYPRFVSIVSESLEVEEMEISCVCGGFPSSQTFPEVKTIETALAVKDGATEVDFVLPVGFFLAGDYEQVFDEISEIKATCGEETPLKVILETGALQTAVQIKKAALLSMYAGADFIKTSTGKVEPGAKPYAVMTMCEAIKEYFDQTERKVGIKIAGGVRNTDDAISYYTIVKEMLGKEWLSPKLLRIGASNLANHLLSDITGEPVSAF